MKQKSVLIFAAILIFFGLQVVLGQTKMYVKENSDTQSEYLLTNIRKIVFGNDNIIVTKTDESHTELGIEKIRYISFSDFYTNVPLVSTKDIMNMLIYPNPVHDQLYLETDLKYVNPHTVKIQIIDIHGQIMLSHTTNNYYGLEPIILNVSHLTHGVYVCQLFFTDQYNTLKFIKQ